MRIVHGLPDNLPCGPVPERMRRDIHRRLHCMHDDLSCRPVPERLQRDVLRYLYCMLDILARSEQSSQAAVERQLAPALPAHLDIVTQVMLPAASTSAPIMYTRRRASTGAIVVLLGLALQQPTLVK